MATAEKSTQPVYETVQVHVRDETQITLELTQEEAEVLQVILTRVGGNPSGPRGKAAAVSQALESVLGSPFGENRYSQRVKATVAKYPFSYQSGLCFKDEEES